MIQGSEVDGCIVHHKLFFGLDAAWLNRFVVRAVALLSATTK